MHIPQFAVRLLAGLVLLGAVLLVVLTRTQMGRDTVARQAVAAFNRTYAGRLEVGPVTGNLVRDLHARDVRLYAPDGSLVAEADSVVLNPSWRSLFSNTIRTRRLVLFRPHLRLEQDSAAVWNLAAALHKRTPSERRGAPFVFDASTVIVRDGRFTLRRDRPPPAAVAAGQVFDHRRLTVEAIDAELAVDWRTSVHRLGIEALSFRLPDQQIDVDAFAAGLTQTDAYIEVDAFRLVTRQSRVSGSAQLALTADRMVRIALDESRIAASELRAFLPALPLGDRFTLAGRVAGPLRDLTVEALQVSRAESRLVARGRVRGLPDSLALDLDVPELAIRTGDVEALLPGMALPPPLLRLGDLAASGQVRGAVRPRLRLDAELDATSEAGAVDGQLTVVGAPDSPLRVRLDARVEGLDPGRLTGDERYTGALTGTVALDQLTPNDSLARSGTAFRIRLGPSELAGRRADSLSAEGLLRGTTLAARLAIRQGPSRVEGTLRGDAERRQFGFEGRFDAFDVRRVVPGAVATQLSGAVRLAITAPSLAALAAELDADLEAGALLRDGGAQPLPSGPLRVVLTPPGVDGPRLTVESVLVDATLDGDLDAEAALALGPYWAAVLAHEAKAAYAKPLRGEPTLAPPPPPARVERLPQAFEIGVTVRDAPALTALLPVLPHLASGTALTAQGTMGSEALTLDFSVRSDSLAHGPVAAGRLEVSGAVRAGKADAVPTVRTARLEGRAGTLQLGPQRADQVLLTASLDGDRATLAVAALRPGAAGRIDLAGTLDLLPDRNRLVLTRTHIDAGGSAWSARAEPVFDLYADAVLVRALRLERAESDADQYIALRGVLSNAPADTLYATVSGFDLGEIARSTGASWRGAFPGGRLDARLAATRLLSTPEVTGTVSIPRLQFDDRLVGRLDLKSRFVPGTDAVAVELRLDRPNTALPIPADVRLEENVLRVQGRLRLPGRSPEGVRDPGLLDLDLVLERADLFFFDYLFPDLVTQASGYATGTGQIGGTFSRPLFEATVAAPQMSAAIPRYGLAFEGSGEVHVDERGIHVDEARLRDEAGGRGVVRGSLLFNDYRFFSLDFQAALDEVEIVDVPDDRSGLPFYGLIRASGDATITGPLDRVFLRSANAVTTPDSEIFIPIASDAVEADRGFLLYADADGRIPEFRTRTSVVGPRPEGERSFSEGLEMNLNVTTPPGSTVHLVFDPLVGDVIDARGSADLQLRIRDGVFETFGTFTVSGGDYAFVAGDVFTRRFSIEPGGTLVWDGDPLDAAIDLTADFRTRASLAGLGLGDLDDQRVPLVIRTRVGGRLTAPLVTLALDLDTDARSGSEAAVEALRPLLNDADRQALYATSVLLTGTFLLAPVENAAVGGDVLTGAADELLFTSLSQLVSNRLNLFLSQALASDNVEVLLGLQPGEQLQDFDLTYGVALRFLDERLVIRGEGVYQQLDNQPAGAGVQGEVAVEVRLTSNVALEVFYRRESELLGGTSVGVTPYGAYGAGLRYEAAFTSWQAALRRLLGRAGSTAAG